MTICTKRFAIIPFWFTIASFANAMDSFILVCIVVIWLYTLHMSWCVERTKTQTIDYYDGRRGRCGSSTSMKMIIKLGLSDDVENLTTKTHRSKQLDEKTMLVSICEMFLLSEIENPHEKFQNQKTNKFALILVLWCCIMWFDRTSLSIFHRNSWITHGAI